MSFLLTCPNCGVREVTDFGYGGESSKRPAERPASLRELSAYNYFRRNVAGVQREWVGAPLGLPRVVSCRARHDDERGPVDGVAGRRAAR